MRNKDLEAGGHRATGFPKAGGPTENPVAKMIFFFKNHKNENKGTILPLIVTSNHTSADETTLTLSKQYRTAKKK